MGTFVPTGANAKPDGNSVPEDLGGSSRTSVHQLADFSGPAMGAVFFACLPKDEIHSEGRGSDPGLSADLF